MFAVAKEEAKRFMSPPVTPSKQITTSQEVTTTPYDVSRHSNVADVASDVLRMRKVKQKLDSVLVSKNFRFFFTSLSLIWKKKVFFATSLGDTSFAKANGYSNATNSGSKQLNPREIRWCLLFRIYTPRKKAW